MSTSTGTEDVAKQSIVKQSIAKQSVAKKWYQEFWFWFVFGPLIFIILLCCVTVTIAFKNADDVVTDNYYKSGLMINQTLKQDETAAALNLKAELKFDAETHEVTMNLSGNEELPKQLILFLDNPAKSAQDQHVALTEISRGNYRGDFSGVLQYAWYLALVPTDDIKQRKTAHWLLTGEINFAKTNQAALQSRLNSPKKNSVAPAE